MKNWLDQDIVPGEVVYRGARQGDSSNFRVGIVDSVNEEKKNVTVAWFLGHKGVSTVGLDTVVIIGIDENVLYEAGIKHIDETNKRYAKIRAEHPDWDSFNDIEPWW